MGASPKARRVSHGAGDGCSCAARDGFERRRREAQELHDAVAQTVFGVRLVAQQIGPAYERGPAEGAAQVERLLELTRTALVQLRTTCAALSDDGRCHRARAGGRVRTPKASA